MIILTICDDLIFILLFVVVVQHHQRHPEKITKNNPCKTFCDSLIVTTGPIGTLFHSALGWVKQPLCHSCEMLTGTDESNDRHMKDHTISPTLYSTI